MDKNVWLPCVALPYVLPISAKVQFKQVACGSHHTIAVSRAGEVYACGLSSSGQLGLSQQQIGAEGILNVFEMTKVQFAPGQNHVVSQAHCGNNFTLLLTQNGAVLSAGSGRYGIHCTFDKQHQIQDANATYNKS
jgi:alpha-tubulin suppressor-like RCC1 family protein